MIDYSSWLADIRARLARSSILFLQVGSAHEPARVALLNSGMKVVSVRDYIAGEEGDHFGDLIICDLEDLVIETSGGRLGELRAVVHERVEAGGRTILLSRSPRRAFPDVAGSSLLHDAAFAHAPFVRASTVADLPASLGGEEESSDLLVVVLKELGGEICGVLDRVIYESVLTDGEALSALEAREREALDAAGLTYPDGGERVWNFSWHFSEIKNALDEVIPHMLVPQAGFQQVCSGLWEIERLIRRRLRLELIKIHSNGWKSASFEEDLREKVLERAISGGYLAASSIKHVRDPLEWLSLGELRGIVLKQRVNGLGIQSRIWSKFDDEVLPIRNRVAHMRLIHPGDGLVTSKWVKVLRGALGE